MEQLVRKPFTATELQEWPVMRAREVFHQLELLDPVPALPGTLRARAHNTQGTLGPPKVRIPHRPGDGIAELSVGHVPASARSRSDGIDAEGAAGSLDVLFGIVCGRDPSLRLESEGIREAVFVVVHSVWIDADIVAGRNILVVDDMASGADFSP